MSTGITTHPTLEASQEALHPMSTAERFRRYLSAYWLRPENALWMTLRSMALSEVEWARPSLDVCCGDGVFTYLHLGGVFEDDFDVFTSVGKLDKVTHQHADMFDHADDHYRPGIISPAFLTVDVGTDHKQTLLTKASRLHLYDQLEEHDGNRTFPFEGETFQTVYCNAAYWIHEIDSFLKELGRITQRQGHIILQVKLDSMDRYNLSSLAEMLGGPCLDIIGRGRVDCWPTLTDRSSWEKRFARAGLDILKATPFVTRTHAHLWDIGLRPIAPMLIKMAQAIDPQTRSDIKQEWIELFLELLGPLCDPDLDLFPGQDEPAEIQFVLSPIR